MILEAVTMHVSLDRIRLIACLDASLCVMVTVTVIELLCLRFYDRPAKVTAAICVFVNQVGHPKQKFIRMMASLMIEHIFSTVLTGAPKRAV